MRALITCCAALLLWACSHKDEGSPPERVRADALALGTVCAADATNAYLEQIDSFIAERKPVAAAERITQAAMPANDRVAAQLAPLRMSTPEGQRMLNMLRGVYGARNEAMRRWAEVLSRGENENEELAQLAAFRAHRQAEAALLALLDQLDAMKRDGRLPSALPAQQP